LRTAAKILGLAGALALVAFPATGVAKRGEHGKQGKHAEHAKGGKGCAKAHSRGFQVGGTLVSMTADVPATEESEATVTLTVTSANKHARESGELADQNADRKGVQAKGATYTVPVGDAYELRLSNDYGTGAPAAGDRVKVKGRVPVTRKRCADEGTTTADRYGTPDVTRVSVKPAEVQSEPEAPEVPDAPETETPS
jgi:hypothetical protein